MTSVFLLIGYASLLARLAAPYPFAVGETLRYDAKLGYFPVGTATAKVSRLAQERGEKAFVFAMTGAGGPPGYRVQFDLTSWVDSNEFNSLRFHRRLLQAGKVEEHEYVIVPDSARYREAGVPGDWVSPTEPLDELAFLYYLRTAPLKVGKSYSFARYFKTGYNPIQVTVTGRESVPLPNGTAPCLAVEVATHGTSMRVWLTDDARRLPAQLELPLPFGVVTLQLTSQTQ
jgi:Protein of unknown function (DUF3108)